MNEVRPVMSRPWTLLGSLVFLAAIAVFLLQSKLLGLMPPCVFYKFTGLHCPGCGGRRCMMMLAQGRIFDALQMNALVIAIFMGFGIFFLRQIVLEWKLGSVPQTILAPKYAWAIVWGILGFWVLRNVPLWPFTLLAPFR
jgi:hypothetical protein